MDSDWSDSLSQRIPISLSLMTNMEGWQVNADLKDASHGKFQVVTAEINMYRGPTQRFFSLFIGSLMWLLGGSVFWLAFTLCLRKRKVEPPTIVCPLNLV